MIRSLTLSIILLMTSMSVVSASLTPDELRCWSKASIPDIKDFYATFGGGSVRDVVTKLGGDDDAMLTSLGGTTTVAAIILTLRALATNVPLADLKTESIPKIRKLAALIVLRREWQLSDFLSRIHQAQI